MTSALVAVLFASAASAGASHGFSSTTNNNAGDVGIGEAQLSVELKNTAGQVEFLYKNTGPDAAVITQIYWFDTIDLLSSFDSWSPTTPSGPDHGVDYGSPANIDQDSGKLPGYGGKNIADFALRPDNPQPKNGVGPGEDLSVFFNFTGDYLDLLEAIDTGELVTGIHVQSFKSGGSESFVTNKPPKPPTGVPSPTAAFAGLGLMGLLVSRRRRPD